MEIAIKRGMKNYFDIRGRKMGRGVISLLYKPTSNLKTMNHETKATLKAALATGYILLVAMFGIAYFGRFIFALITN